MTRIKMPIDPHRWGAVNPVLHDPVYKFLTDYSTYYFPAGLNSMIFLIEDVHLAALVMIHPRYKEVTYHA